MYAEKSLLAFLIAAIFIAGCQKTPVIENVNDTENQAINAVVDDSFIKTSLRWITNFSLAFSPDRKNIAVFSPDGIHLYDSITLNEKFFSEQKFRDLSDTYLSIAFSPDGKYLAYSDGFLVRMLNLSTRKVEKTIYSVVPSLFVTDIGISWDNDYVILRTDGASRACEGGVGHFALYDVGGEYEKIIYNGKFFCTLGRFGYSNFRFTQDGRVYFFYQYPTDLPYAMEVVDLEKKIILESVSYESSMEPRYYDVSPNGKFLTSISYDTTREPDYYRGPHMITQIIDAKTRKVISEEDGYVNWWSDNPLPEKVHFDCDTPKNRNEDVEEILSHNEISIFLIIRYEELPILEKWDMSICEKVKTIFFSQ